MFQTLVVPEGQCMDYSEVVTAFSRLVETHFLQRSPPMTPAGSSTSGGADSNPPSVTEPIQPETNPDCYKLPYINISGELLQSEVDDTIQYKLNIRLSVSHNL